MLIKLYSPNEKIIDKFISVDENLIFQFHCIKAVAVEGCVTYENIMTSYIGNYECNNTYYQYGYIAFDQTYNLVSGDILRGTLSEKDPTSEPYEY